jgi:hypothetical protein
VARRRPTSSSPPAGDWVSLRDHLAALKVAEEKFAAERDRRYAEVNLEREKALKIKDTADRDALALARADQTYKDERANNLRTQLERERGDYASKDDLIAVADKLDATIRPLVVFMSTRQGREGGFDTGWKVLVAAATLALGIWLAFHK